MEDDDNSWVPSDEWADDADGEELMAAILTLFAVGINPLIDREVAFDLLLQAQSEGGLGVHNAQGWGELLKRTTHGTQSKTKH